MLFNSLSSKSKKLMSQRLVEKSALDDFVESDAADVVRQDAKGGVRGSAPDAKGVGRVDSELASRKKHLTEVLDLLEIKIREVLIVRQAEERIAHRSILIIGACVLVIVLLSVFWSVYNKGEQNLLQTLFSGAGSAALLAVLYFPVRKILQIANDRSLLMLLPVTFKMQVQAASNIEALDSIGENIREELKSIFDADAVVNSKVANGGLQK